MVDWSFDIIRAYHESGIRYIGTLQASPSQNRLIEAVSEHELLSNPVTYLTSKGPQLCYAVRKSMTIPAESRGKKLNGVDAIEEPALVVYSPGLRENQQKEREKWIGRYLKRLMTISGYLNKSHYCKRSFTQNQLEKAAAEHPGVARFVTVQLEGEDKGLSLTVTRNEEAIREAGKFDGRYLVLFNCSELDDEDIIRRLKARDVVERRNRDLKGVIEVSPVYLHNDQRIKGLLFICVVALLVQSLVEMKLRRANMPMTARKMNEQLTWHKASVVTMVDRSKLLVVPDPKGSALEVIHAPGLSLQSTSMVLASDETYLADRIKPQPVHKPDSAVSNDVDLASR